MTTWADVDEWYRARARKEWTEHPHPDATARRTRAELARVGRQLRREELGELRAFCVLLVGEGPDTTHLRFRCRANGTRLYAERPCYYVPGKWRAAWWADISEVLAMRPEVQRFNGLTRQQLDSVLVARDAWLEAGAPRRSRLPVVT